MKSVSVNNLRQDLICQIESYGFRPHNVNRLDEDDLLEILQDFRVSDYYKEEPVEESEAYQEVDTEGKQTIVVNGEELQYELVGTEIKYYRNNQEVKGLDMNTANTNLVVKTTTDIIEQYNRTVENYGIQKDWLVDRFNQYAYKQHWITNNGNVMYGEYLVVHNGKPVTIREITYQGQMTVKPLEPRQISFYPLEQLDKLGNIEVISKFNSKARAKKSSSTEDFDSMFDAQMDTINKIEVIEVLKITLGTQEYVTFYNTSNGMHFGSKLYSVYEAEQKAKTNIKVNLDDAFEASLNQENKSMSLNMDEKHVCQQTMDTSDSIEPMSFRDRYTECEDASLDTELAR